MKFLLLFVALAAILLGTRTPASADPPSDLLPAGLLGGYQREDAPWGTVYHRGWSEASGQLSGRVREALSEVEERIGRKRRSPFTAVLTPDRRDFARVFEEIVGRNPEATLAGVAFPARDLLLVRGDLLPLLLPPGDRPSAVLSHELAHLVIHQPPGLPVPRWFDEGVAQWASGKSIDPGEEAFLSGLARLKGLPRLSDLDHEMPRPHDLATLGYEEGLLAVEWIVLRFGPSAPRDILDRLAKGETFVDAFRARTGLDAEALDAAFLNWMRGRRSLWEAAAAFFQLYFWTLVALLAVAAIVRGLFRRRRLLRRMEVEERTEESVGERGPGEEEAPAE